MDNYTKGRRFAYRLMVTALAACATGMAHAAHPGDLDGAFGGSGYLTNDFFGTDAALPPLATSNALPRG